ncbi:theronine dehydrogenase, partial [Salmonella enterica subsp. enterica serovar Newport]|nr:theronine dehydrogenase [Salmonella enterica subsp. enterica serovar Newport]
SDERKAAARRRNLERRVNRIAPLFADELIERELETRPEYFQGKTMNMPPKGGESC